MKKLLYACASASLLLLTSCGFHLRESYQLPYQGIYLSAPASSLVAASLRREIVAAGSKLLPDPTGADGQLTIIDEKREKQILSLSGAGRVREYQLKLTLRYQLQDAQAAMMIPPSEIQLSRILGYDDKQIIAKQQEEGQLYLDMEKDVVGQILRRMAAVKRGS